MTYSDSDSPKFIFDFDEGRGGGFSDVGGADSSVTVLVVTR